MNSAAQMCPEAPPSGRRRELVDKAREQWTRKLIDLSRRNNLLYFRALKTGTLDLAGAPPDRMAALLAGEAVPVSKLVPEERENLLELVRGIARRALGNLEEKGLQTLFVALGSATWRTDDEGRPPDSPVLLVPVTLSAQGSQSFSLARDGNVQVNLVLLHVLETQFGLRATADELIPLMRGDEEGEFLDPQPLYNEIIRRAAAIEDFAIRPTAILGNFAFQKMAMVKDLRERGAELAAHDLIAAIAGDPDARAQAGACDREVSAKELDRTPPEHEFFVLDADSSQQCAVDAILRGQNAVVHGPPGTGKSQTIVNLIASLAATGKRVLFVAEKKAALDVVMRRLHHAGLDHLAIDLHGADVAPKKVMEQVGRALEKVRLSPPVAAAAVHARVTERRARLNDHVERMHRLREPAAMSVYQLQGLLLRLERTVSSNTRWRGEELNRITPACAERIRDALREAGGYAPLFLRTDSSHWTGAPLTDGNAAQAAVDLMSRLAAQVLPGFSNTFAALSAACSFVPARTMAGQRAITTLVAEMQQTLAAYSSAVLDNDPGALATRLVPGCGGAVRAAWAWLTNPGYREARSALLAMRKAGKASTGQLYQEAAAAASQLQRWQSLCPVLPAEVPGHETLARGFSVFWAAFDELQRALGRDLGALTPEQFAALVTSLSSDHRTPYLLPKLTGIERELEQLGVSNLVAEIRQTQPPSAHWMKMFDVAWYASTLDSACLQDPELSGFHGQTHDGFVGDFVQLDEERIALASARVRRAHAERAIQAMNAHREQELLIRAESQKTRRHMPLRRLFTQAGEVLTAICPCWMASPLSVSQLLDGGKRHFDYVVFDEASQVLPEDAVCAILRGDKLVVAGDQSQLPPTIFFAAGTDDDLAADEEADALAADGYESLLDLATAFLPSNYLDWHYRSRDEALIAFSNHHIYRDRLVTFPGPGLRPAVAHVLVQQESGKDGEEESCGAEVRKVVELALEHARRRPEETLGIITMGIKHRDRVQRALDHALPDHPELSEFFDESKPERYFIKNLEAVQGDERDAILITAGYGKDRGGTLPFRFGPLLPAGGRRRLNVAVSRARQRITLVSSFSHLDMDIRRVRPGSGVELLRDYLEYAASNGKKLGDTVLTTVAPNDFEQDIHDALSARGLSLVPQLGASHFRIDLVAVHPRKPGRYVLAIECDGATYHSSNTARDRDRLRQQQLESLGWRFHRIWSTDWFLRKSEEVERAVKAFEAAVACADQMDAGGGNGTGGNGPAHNHADEPRPNGRGARPLLAPRKSIDEYDHRDLYQILRWINSNGLMRTDDELVKEMADTLGFKRRGVRIEATIRYLIQEWRRTSS